VVNPRLRPSAARERLKAELSSELGHAMFLADKIMALG
jgi:hypothetical protein